MGARLSASEKGIYVQVKSTLRSGEKVFIKRELKAFVNWLFVRFPKVSVRLVLTLEFWDEVGRILSDKSKSGDLMALKYLRLFLMISDALEKQGIRRSCV